MKKINLNVNMVMAILLRALDYIDVRLVDHGHRVAYIVYKMMKTEGTYSETEMQQISIVVALHDIGAYKTEEIDNMLQFESIHFLDHSIYGYLFLKHMTPLSKWAEIVLYHHLDFEKYDGLDCEYLNISDMIHFADRMDIVLQKQERWLNLDEMRKQQDIRFGKSTMELFQKANDKYDIEGSIKNGSYLKELTALISTAKYSEEKLLDYIKMIAYSIDFRSETTVSHVITTVSISVELGKLFGLEGEDLKKIVLGAYLHDIGKISTPLEILEKPGSLTSEETVIMREHIDITEKILLGRISNDILRIAYRHHEKMDGSGYPHKLKAEQLSLSERIVAVADTMSALIGKRSYKESFPKEVVVDILQEQKDGGKLCGQVIDEAILHYEEIMESSGKNSKVTLDIYNSIRKEFELIKKKLEAL